MGLRKSPLPPRTQAPRRTPVKKVNRKRKASEFARCYHSRARVQWIKALPCIVCDSISVLFGEVTRGACHNAHTIGGGAHRKAGYETIVPLCAAHHRRYDDRLPPFGDAEARIATKAAALKIEAAWQAEVARRPPQTRGREE